MNELLANPAVQAALVTAIVVGLNAIVAWLKQKFPTQNALVEANWTYLQPVVVAAMSAAREAIIKSSYVPAVGSVIIAKALSEFCDMYRKLEGKDATMAEINAAQTEITAAVARVTGG